MTGRFIDVQAEKDSVSTRKHISGIEFRKKRSRGNGSLYFHGVGILEYKNFFNNNVIKFYKNMLSKIIQYVCTILLDTDIKTKYGMVTTCLQHENEKTKCTYNIFNLLFNFGKMYKYTLQEIVLTYFCYIFRN